MTLCLYIVYTIIKRKYETIPGKIELKCHTHSSSLPGYKPIIFRMPNWMTAIYCIISFYRRINHISFLAYHVWKPIVPVFQKGTIQQ